MNPNFIDIWNRITLATYITPLLPQPLYLFINPQSTQSKTPGSAATALTAALTEVTDDASTAGSMISGLTGATGLTGRKTQLYRAGSLITNENPDAHPLYLSFHVKGACFSNYHCSKNHAHILTLSEKSDWKTT